jgi:transcription initiation factor TFIIB
LEKILRTCPECGSNFILYMTDTGEEVCKSCGLVVREMSLEMGPERRAFTPEEKEQRSRAGGNVSLLSADMGLATTIPKQNKDASGRTISPQIQKQMQRMRKLHTSTQYASSQEKNLIRALAELDRIAGKLHIPKDLQEEAASIYRDTLNRNLVRGRSIPAIVAASVYAAYRTSGRQRTLKEVASVSGCRRGYIARCYWLLLREVPIKMPIPVPRTYISKIATKANIPEKTQNVALQILDKIERKETVGKDPVGLAAAALYIACKLTGFKRTQRKIAASAEVSEVTVRNRAKGLKGSLMLQLPKYKNK